MSKINSVIGIYPDRAAAADAVKVLVESGAQLIDVSTLASEGQAGKDFAHQRRNKAFEGAGMGGALGAAVGFAAAWMLSHQLVTIAGLGALIAAGPVVVAMTCAGIGGSFGWVGGFLAGWRVPEYVAKRYTGKMRFGGILVSVHCDNPDREDRVRKTLKATGAKYISSVPESPADYGTTVWPEPVGDSGPLPAREDSWSPKDRFADRR